jgi:tetratricopeptide (TPR) repeat protein
MAHKGNNYSLKLRKYYFCTRTGFALYKLNKFDEAKKAFDKAIELNPQNSMAWYNRACIYSLINNKNQSVFNLKRAIELDLSHKEEAKKEEDFKRLWTDEQFEELIK